MTTTSDVSLGVFDRLRKGDPAPAWLADVVVSAWGFTAHEVEVTPIAASENVTFLVRLEGAPTAVTRVARRATWATSRRSSRRSRG